MIKDLNSCLKKQYTVFLICSNGEMQEIKQILEHDYAVTCCNICDVFYNKIVLKTFDTLVAYVDKKNDNILNTIQTICSYYPDLPRIMILKNKENVDLMVKCIKIGFHHVICIDNIQMLNERVIELINNSKVKVSMQTIGITPCANSKLVEDALDYMEKNYIIIDRIRKVADYLRVTPKTIAKNFKNAGLPEPYKILRRLKARHALNSMKENRLTLKEIAAKSGFSNEKILAENLKKLFNKTPTQCKEAIQDITVKDFWDEYVDGNGCG